MYRINVTKLITLIIVDVGAIFLSYMKILSEQAVTAILSASLGYVFGNGHQLIEK